MADHVVFEQVDCRPPREGDYVEDEDGNMSRVYLLRVVEGARPIYRRLTPRTPVPVPPEPAREPGAADPVERLRAWCAEDVGFRSVKAYIHHDLVTVYLRDPSVRHGAGHNYAGVGQATTLAEAVERAMDVNTFFSFAPAKRRSNRG